MWETRSVFQALWEPWFWVSTKRHFHRPPRLTRLLVAACPLVPGGSELHFVGIQHAEFEVGEIYLPIAFIDGAQAHDLIG